MREAIAETDRGDDGVEPFLIGGPTSKIHRKGDVFERSQGGHKIECLKDEPDRVAAQACELLVVQAAEIDIADEDSTRVDGVEAGDAMHKCGFAAA